MYNTLKKQLPLTDDQIHQLHIALCGRISYLEDLLKDVRDTESREYYSKFLEDAKAAFDILRGA
jgi:hypothetical protein